MLANIPCSRSQTGFTLVEVMIALTLSLLLGGAIVTIFVNNSYSFNQDENIARMQDDARHALREIAFDVRMAGFYADLHLPEAVTPNVGMTIGIDCGPAGELNWMYRTVNAGTGESLSITALDNATNAAAASAHSCFQSGELLEGTDVLSIKRVAGTPATALTTGNVYLRTNGTVGLMFNGPSLTSPPIVVNPPFADWAFRPSIYYIRQYANAPGDNVPTLCKKTLRGTPPAMVTECLATGIENLQIEYGIDTDQDGNPDTYMTSPSLANMQDVVAARLFLLARTTETDSRYTNDKTYSISNAPSFIPGDAFHRRVFSTSVAIQNIRSINMMSL